MNYLNIFNVAMLSSYSFTYALLWKTYPDTRFTNIFATFIIHPLVTSNSINYKLSGFPIKDLFDEKETRYYGPLSSWHGDD